MIADFGLSRVMETDKLSLLTEICGTPGVSLLFFVCLTSCLFSLFPVRQSFPFSSLSLSILVLWSRILLRD